MTTSKERILELFIEVRIYFQLLVHNETFGKIKIPRYKVWPDGMCLVQTITGCGPQEKWDFKAILKEYRPLKNSNGTDLGYEIAYWYRRTITGNRQRVRLLNKIIKDLQK